MKKILRLLIISFIFCFTYADDLGVIGNTYPIAEPDMIDVITNKARKMVADGEWDKIKEKSIAKAKEQVYNPPAITGITHTKMPKTTYYNPVFHLDHNILSPDGRLIAKAGYYNPLKFKPFNTEMLFIDGNDEMQVNWAVNIVKTNNIKTKIVLTSGSYINLDRKFKIWFYYDQNGVYTTKLGITHVPATVTQAGTQLKVDEIPLDGDAA